MAQTPNHPNPPIPRVRDEGWIVGKLLAHGPAPYQHDPKQSMSYFMRLQTLETEQGARQRHHDGEQDARPIDGRVAQRGTSAHQGGVQEFWSKDLKRAIRESKSAVEIGKVVAAKIVSREAIERAPSSKPTGKDDINYRNRWEVETPDFVARRARFARVVNENYQQARREGIDGKEALGLYLIHAGARAVAGARYTNPEDREAFLQRVKSVIEASPERAALIAKTFERVRALKSALKLPEPSSAQASMSNERPKDPFTRE